MVEDSMGLESNIYQLVQKSTAMFPQETQSHNFSVQNQDNLKIKPLSILQTPSTIAPIAKTPKARGRPKGSKITIEIAASIQTTLDNSFTVIKRSTRRTRCSPYPQ